MTDHVDDIFDDRYFEDEKPEVVAFIREYVTKMCVELGKHVLPDGKSFTPEQVREIAKRFFASVKRDPGIERARAWACAAYDVAHLVPYNSPEVDRILAELKAKKDK